VQTGVPPSVLDEWLKLWPDEYQLPAALRAQLRPVSAGSEFLELSIVDGFSSKVANMFADFQDRHGNKVLSIRGQNTIDLTLRRKRLMTLAHLYLIHRYGAGSMHYLSPTEYNRHHTERMKALGIFGSLNREGGLMITAAVQGRRIGELLNPDRVALRHLIDKRSA
jgi:isocitrate lyase